VTPLAEKNMFAAPETHAL